MCNLTKSIKTKTVIVYKVVAKKNDEYYSLAMGFKYPKRGFVPIPKEQKRLSVRFSDSILIDSWCGFQKNMIGRTAGFIRLESAKREADQHISYLDNEFKVIVIKITLSKELMSGSYIDSVIAGKYICKIEEI